MEHHYYRWVGEKHTHVEGGNIGVQVPGIHIDPRGFIEMVEPQSIMNYGKVEEGRLERIVTLLPPLGYL